MKWTRYSLIFLATLLQTSHASAQERVVNFHVNYKMVNFTGRPAKAIAINNQIPGPTLRFREGDHVTINVYNHLDKGTAVHWHGLLVPWHMDGVAHVTQEPIPPGGVFHYSYTIKQSGTYWYHAHSGLQEQQGLYGAYIIDPIRKPRWHYNKEFTVMLSDWIDTDPDQVYANLKKDGDYYTPKFPLQPSLLHFMRSYKNGTTSERKQLIEAYRMMQTSRMSPYDISDVAYDMFLLNGKTPYNPWKRLVKVGDTVRLRFIDAGASSIFRIKIPGTSMRVVEVQGNEVTPYSTDSLLMSPGETIDVLVKITQNRPYAIYAESADQISAALGVLVTNKHQTVSLKEISPFPEPKPLMMSMANMQAGHMPMRSQQLPDDSPYKKVRALNKTNYPQKPAKIIHLKLSGYMDRYIWFLNGLPEYLAKPILIEPGKRYRLVFENASIMRHPMHLHGHWMFLRNGNGAYDPKVHTIDVGPNETISADFDADAKDGFWYFHCHNLYHMKAGMATVVRYANTPEANDIHQDDDSPYTFFPYIPAHPAGWYRASYVELGINPLDTYYQINYKFLFGRDYNKLELQTKDAEIDKGTLSNADLDIFYWHVISQFWSIKAGANYFYRPAKTPYWQPGVGIEGLAPYFINTDIRLYLHRGSLKLDADLSRDTQLTNRLFLTLELRPILASKTVAKDSIGSGLNEVQYTIKPYYIIKPGMALYAQYEHDQSYGVTKSILKQNGDEATSDTVSVGFSFTF